MSDRANTITVVLDQDIRVGDDLQPVLTAIRMIKGVLSAEANVADAGEYMAIQRATWDVEQRFREILYPRSK